ncbi:hypothetical protein [Acidisoma cladoniae]|jgi:hypothetical protein|uniref:hypothetical protein n=1 Tax=Acidisoma cladoniae TaxID=3040935 RepID=UPI00254ADEF1|nr:hypothetical protein [Acidisoma sp. PAMC 29798]
MPTLTKTLALLPALSLFCALGAAPAAMAQSSSAMSEAAGATTGLGTHHRFTSVAAANGQCPGDTIVWHSGPGMSYVMPGTPAYGKSGGFYACKAEADTAGFHNSNM